MAAFMESIPKLTTARASILGMFTPITRIIIDIGTPTTAITTGIAGIGMETTAGMMSIIGISQAQSRGSFGWGSTGWVNPPVVAVGPN